MRQEKGVAFLDGATWYHQVKILNNDGSVSYDRLKGFDTKKSAEESYYRHKEMFDRGMRKYMLENKVNRNILLQDYLVYWLEEIYIRDVDSTITREIAKYVLYDMVLPNAGDDIKLQYANTEYLDALLERTTAICDSAGNMCRIFLNLAFKNAVIDEYVTTNPVAGTKPYPRKRPSIVILKKGQIRKLLKVAVKNPWYLEILLALFCGLRKGEIRGLKFADFDFENNTVRIDRQLATHYIYDENGKRKTTYIEKEPKNENSYRTLKVPGVIMEELKKRKAIIECDKESKGGAYEDNGFISCQADGNAHSVTAMNLVLTKLCVRNGLPAISVHGLRHMYATILMEEKVPLVKISALLGHSSVTTTFEYYCDIMDEDDKIISFMNETFAVDDPSGRKKGVS